MKVGRSASEWERGSGLLQARHAVLGAERSQLQARLAGLKMEVEASQQATAALDTRNLTGEALLSKVPPLDPSPMQNWARLAHPSNVVRLAKFICTSKSMTCCEVFESHFTPCPSANTQPASPFSPPGMPVRN